MNACELCGAEPAGCEVRWAHLDLWVRLCQECFEKHALAFRTSPLAVKSVDRAAHAVDRKRFSGKTARRGRGSHHARRRDSEGDTSSGTPSPLAVLGDTGTGAIATLSPRCTFACSWFASHRLAEPPQSVRTRVCDPCSRATTRAGGGGQTPSHAREICFGSRRLSWATRRCRVENAAASWSMCRC